MIKLCARNKDLPGVTKPCAAPVLWIAVSVILVRLQQAAGAGQSAYRIVAQHHRGARAVGFYESVMRIVNIAPAIRVG